MTHQSTQWEPLPNGENNPVGQGFRGQPNGPMGKPNGSGVMTQRVGEFPKVMTQWGKTRRLRGICDSFAFRAGKAKIRLLSNSTRNSRISKSTPSDKRALCHQCSKCIPIGWINVHIAKTSQKALGGENTRTDTYPLAKVIHTASSSYPLGQLLYKTATCG
jgi:hypothetical protein